MKKSSCRPSLGPGSVTQPAHNASTLLRVIRVTAGRVYRPWSLRSRNARDSGASQVSYDD